MDEARGSHRTRSKAAPDWTTEESIILIDEINAVESEWGEMLPSFQRWQQIVENCNALDVNRNLNQCKRQWDTLLGDYRRVKEGVGSFPVELLEAIDRCVMANGKKNEVSCEVATAEEEQAVIDTDLDSDPGEQVPVKDAFPGPGSKRQRHRMKRKRGRVERKKPWGYYTSIKTIHGESSNINVKLVKSSNNINVNDPWRNMNKCITKVTETSADTEKRMATILWENALQINRVLDGNLVDEMHTESTDMKNAVETDFIRRQGDELISYLGKISTTLNQLSDLVQQH